MGQFVQAIKGIGDACRALDFPIVSGNVSLYNETNGQAILPTPTIAGVGLLDDWSKMATVAFKAAGQVVLLVGSRRDFSRGHLGQSAYLRTVFGRTDGPPPPVDLEHEKRVGDFVRDLIRRGIASAVHDVSDGGVAVAFAEMAMAGRIGGSLPGPADVDPILFFFGEDQGRYLVALTLDPHGDEITALWKEAEALGIFAPWVGTTGGDSVKLGDHWDVPLADLVAAHEGWFPKFMDGAH
jgi:phosphoribosylformylglycinamidine synthase